MLWAQTRFCCLLPPLSPPPAKFNSDSSLFVPPKAKECTQISKAHHSAPKVHLKPHSGCLLCPIYVKMRLRAPATSLKTFLLQRQQEWGICREILGRARNSPVQL